MAGEVCRLLSPNGKKLFVKTLLITHHHYHPAIIIQQVNIAASTLLHLRSELKVARAGL